MNKTINISLNGVHFNIDENAYGKLNHYLEQLRHSLRNEEGKEEIMQDVETRIAELFKQYLGLGRDVVSEQDVDRVIGVMGQPEDYVEDNSASTNNGASADSETTENTGQSQQGYSSENSGEYYTYTTPDGKTETVLKKLYRDLDEKIIGGVLAGISHYFGWNPMILRGVIGALLFLSMFTDFGISAAFWIISYILLWIIIPPAMTNIQKLQMYGEPVNVDSIKKSISKEEINDTVNNVKGFTKEVIHDAGPFVETTAKGLFKIFKGVLGIFLIIFGIAGIIGSFVFLATALASNSYFLNFGDLIFNQPWEFYLFVFFLWAMNLSLAILMIYSGIRLVSTNNQYKNSTLVATCFVVFIAGLFGSIFLGMITATNFQDEVTYYEKDKLNTQSDSLFVSFSDRSNKFYRYKQRGFSSSFGLNESKDSLIVQIDNDIEIKKSLDNNFYIEKIYSSRGKNEENAADNIQSISYKYKLTGNHLDLSRELEIPENSKFRDQDVEIKLYVPQNKFVIFNNVDDIYSDGFFGDDRIDNDGNEAVIYIKGDTLKCLKCGGSNYYNVTDDDVISIQSDDGDVIQAGNDSVMIRSGNNIIKANKDSVSIRSNDGSVDIKIKDN